MVEQLLCCLVNTYYTCKFCKYRLCFECFYVYLLGSEVIENVREGTATCPNCGELG